MASSAEASLAQMEEDIRLCEEFLARDRERAAARAAAAAAAASGAGGAEGGAAESGAAWREASLERLAAAHGLPRGTSAALAPRPALSAEQRAARVAALLSAGGEASRSGAPAAAAASAADAPAVAFARGVATAAAADAGAVASPARRRWSPVPAPPPSAAAPSAPGSPAAPRASSASRPRSGASSPTPAARTSTSKAEAPPRQRRDSRSRSPAPTPPPRPVRPAPPPPPGREARLKLLAQPRVREAAPPDRDAAELAECTFQPVVGRPPRRSSSGGTPEEQRRRSSSGGGGGAAPLPERLHAEALAREAARERARQLVEQAELAQCTFTPAVNPPRDDPDAAAVDGHNGGRGGGPLFHERVPDLIRGRDAARAAALAAAASARECTFAPAVDPNSARIAAALRAAGAQPADVLVRLAGESSTQRVAAARAAALGGAAADGECTFSPAVSAVSERIVAAMGAAGRPVDFVSRQRAHAAASERRLASAAAAAAAEGECTFAPAVPAAAEVLARSRKAAQLGETAAERDARLAVADAVRREGLRRSLEAGLYGALPFAPSLSARSRALSPAPTPLDELVADTRRARARAALAAAAEARTAAACTFRPNLGAAAATSASARRSSVPRGRAPTLPSASFFAADADGAAALVRDARAARERAAQRERAAKEAAELAACTFWPEVHPAPRPQRHPSPVVVRGLGPYLQRKALAARLADEAAQRERRAFLLDAAERPLRATATVPQPFPAIEQHHAKLEQRRCELAARVAAERAREHTFRPATREAANRALLRRILAQPEDSADDAC